MNTIPQYAAPEHGGRFVVHNMHARDGFAYPVISVTQAMRQGVNPADLHMCADWNTRLARGPHKERRVRQAIELRRTAFELRAALNAGVSMEIAA